MWISLLLSMALVTALPQGAPDRATDDARLFRQLDEEIAAVREKLAAAPENTMLLADLGLLLAKGGRFDEAEGAFRHILELEYPSPPAMAALSELLRRRYRFEEAQQLLDQVLPLAPDEPVLKIFAARMAMERMDYERAHAILADFPEDHPRRTTSLLQLAEIAYTTYDYVRAQELVDQALARDPDSAYAYILKSLLHRTRQENDQWIAAAHRAVELDPYDDEARTNLANVLMRGERKLEEGYAQAEIALRLNPYNRLAHEYMGTGWTPHEYGDQPLPADETVRPVLKDLLAQGIFWPRVKRPCSPAIFPRPRRCSSRRWP
jgi:tetratricopeptide (TPR) repeat protein